MYYMVFAFVATLNLKISPPLHNIIFIWGKNLSHDTRSIVLRDKGLSTPQASAYQALCVHVQGVPPNVILL